MDVVVDVIVNLFGYLIASVYLINLLTSYSAFMLSAVILFYADNLGFMFFFFQ